MCGLGKNAHLLAYGFASVPSQANMTALALAGRRTSRICRHRRRAFRCAIDATEDALLRQACHRDMLEKSRAMAAMNAGPRAKARRRRCVGRTVQSTPCRRGRSSGRQACRGSGACTVAPLVLCREPERSRLRPAEQHDQRLTETMRQPELMNFSSYYQAPACTELLHRIVSM